MIETKQRESWRDTGLTEEEVELSRQRDGKNSLSQGKRTSFLKQFFVNLTDPIIRVLLIAKHGIFLFLFKYGTVRNRSDKLCISCKPACFYGAFIRFKILSSFFKHFVTDFEIECSLAC